ncbi:MAG: hypothetical protein GY870_12625 [archaeon]|nr:hypothetical protein [archaeon]
MLLTISPLSKKIVQQSAVTIVGFTREDFNRSFYRNSSAFYSSLEWGIRSAEILKRDDWTCKFCGDKYANYVHHIRGVRQFPEICLHPDFLITICVTCHDHLHRKN